MKQMWWLVFIAVVGIGLWLFIQRQSGTSQRISRTLKDESTRYTASPDGIAASFRYPPGWRLQLERGKIESYRQARIVGPRNAEDTYTCSVSVRESPLKSSGGKYDGVEELVKAYKTHLFVGATIDRETTTRVAGVQGHDIQVSYTLPPPFEPGLKPLEIPVMTRTVFLERGRFIYELIYTADVREYARYAEAFEELLGTLRFD